MNPAGEDSEALGGVIQTIIVVSQTIVGHNHNVDDTNRTIVDVSQTIVDTNNNVDDANQTIVDTNQTIVGHNHNVVGATFSRVLSPTEA